MNRLPDSLLAVKPLLFILLMIPGIFPGEVLGQDPVFTQFYASKIYLNPALTGYEGGAIASMTTRDQWRNIGGSSAIFRSHNVEAALDVPQLKSAFGLQVFSNEMGNTPDQTLKWQKASFSYAFRNRSCNPYNDPGWEMSLGFAISYNRYSLNFDGYTFGSQLHPIYGFNPLAANPLDNFNNGIGRDQYLDLDAGIAFRFSKLSWRGRSDDHLLVGLAAHHLPSRGQGFLGMGGQQSLKTTFHSSYVMNLSGSSLKYQVVPMFRSNMQYASGWAQNGSYKFWSNQFGVVGNVARGSQVWAGAWMTGRVVPNANQDAERTLTSIYSLSLGLGTDIQLGYEEGNPKLKLGMSMDYNLGGTLGDGGRTLEFFAIFHWPSASDCQCFTPFM
ncbi:MAG: PorP/SprF family type IX secretion system membrane protein [Bacteroidia bacterium]|nr:PorP/SprF family type IX secretion system membrane protein [Bacteroidia bacterium]